LPALNLDFLYAALDATAYAAFAKESRKKRAGAIKLHRKSGKRVIRVETLSFPRRGRVPHISLVFREMWDSAALSLDSRFIRRT
jgi:hypothetical protein